MQDTRILLKALLFKCMYYKSSWMKQDYSQIWAEEAAKPQMWLALLSARERTLWFQRQPQEVLKSTKWSFELASHYFNWGLTAIGHQRSWIPDQDTFSTLVWQNIITRKATPQCRRHLSLSFDPSVELNFSFLSCHAANLYCCKPTSLNTLQSQLQFSWFSKPHLQRPVLVKGCGLGSFSWPLSVMACDDKMPCSLNFRQVF